MSLKKKVCIVTASRSEYGLLRWLIDEVKNDRDLELQLVVSGAHLSVDQGLTYQQIEEEGYKIDEKVEMLLSSDTGTGIVKSMGLCAIGFADAFTRLSPEMVVVLGDRYELLPICSAALMLSIPIAHISGGDITEGAIDNEIRNAVTMMSALHFPGVSDSAERIIRMRGNNKYVYPVGEPGLDNFNKFSLSDRKSLARDLEIDTKKKWILLTFHPETKSTVAENLIIIENIINALASFSDIEIVASKANADLGGSDINSYLEKVASQGRIKLYNSLGQLRYLSFMKEAFCVIGNSSSGIVEAPYLGKPVINVGNRQKGRYLSQNVISVAGNKESVKAALNQIISGKSEYLPDNYYGDGYTSVKIKEHIKAYLYNND